MNKKKIVFIIPSLSSGGAEKSLVNLLNNFDYQHYEVDLILLKKSGLFLNSIPNEVSIIHLGEAHFIFSKNILNAVTQFILKFKIKLALNRILFTLKNNLIKNTNKAEQYSWKNRKSCFSNLDKEYDVAVGYLEKTSIYFAVDCIKAKRKIGFIRTDYSKLDLDKNFDEKYFEKLDYLCANGEISRDILSTTFPKLENKLKVVMNVVSTKLINDLSNQVISFDNSKVNIVTVGRLEKVKGFEMAIEACSIIVNSYKKINWYIIGSGTEKENLELKIKALGLENNFFLLGERENPYPYIKQANIYVQTSINEGRSSTINEAKILKKPIVATNFESIYEQIENGVNGLIVEKNAKAIADGIIELLEVPEKASRFSEVLSQEKLGTEDEIIKFYKLIN
jgi:glycosyltransferase involved in cell wall biosynthesis